LRLRTGNWLHLDGCERFVSKTVWCLLARPRRHSECSDQTARGRGNARRDLTSPGDSSRLMMCYTLSVSWASRVGSVALLGLIASGCSDRRAPPGLTIDAGRRVVAAEPDPSAEPMAPAQPSAAGSSEPGGKDDNMPFVSTGMRAASTAFRTWIYTDTGPNRGRYGYLRVGAIVDVRGPPLKNDGCEEGWLRVNPRGFICLGKGATLDLEAPLVREASIRPRRGEGLPYVYALASDEPPHFYFQLPSKAQVRAIEGCDPVSRFEHWRLTKVASVPAVQALLGTPPAPPDFLQNGGRINKPYGALQRLENRVHSGRAAADSGFAILRTMAHEGRWYGMTTEHDLIALDRVRIVVPSALHGIEIPAEAGLPVGFVKKEQLAKFTPGERQSPGPSGALSKRQGVLLTGKKLPGGLVESRDGFWVAAEGLHIIQPRKEYPSFATGDRKWIDISILGQTLVAYLGRKPVYATLISSGRGGMGDPETESATPRGTFMIYAKHVSSTMDGADDVADSFSLLDVPFVQYFHKGFALHGTYWHDEFGRVRSHGCINLAPYDAAWLFEWTDPNVSSDWHGVINKERGTVVHIHG
jgi:hypothetical protein